MWMKAFWAAYWRRNERRRPKINNNGAFNWIVATGAPLQLLYYKTRAKYKRHFSFVCLPLLWRWFFQSSSLPPPLSLSLARAHAFASPSFSANQQYSPSSAVWHIHSQATKKIDLLLGHVHGKQNYKYAHTFLFRTRLAALKRQTYFVVSREYFNSWLTNRAVKKNYVLGAQMANGLLSPAQHLF